jgi:regulator of sigma E protease
VSVLFSVSVFILVLSFLVVIHELGHFLAAKWAKIRVEEFGLGYPPQAKILFEKWGTIFSLNWIPFGGFVKMEGEDGPEEATQKKKRPVDDEGPFYSKSLFKRLVVLLAGASINFIFGIIAFAAVFSISGIPEIVSVDRPRIGAIVTDSPAAQAGLPVNVEILAVRSGDELTEIKTSTDVVEYVKRHSGETITLIVTGECQEETCASEKNEYQLQVRKEAELQPNQGLIGVMFIPVIKNTFYPWYEMPIRGAWYGLQQAVGLSLFIVGLLGQIGRDLFTRATIPNDLAGPFGIADQFHTSGIAQDGLVSVLTFAGMLSVNLAIMNVLPIPALDGGRAVFLLLEKVIGRHRVEKFENQANTIGFALIVGLLMVVSVRDIFRIVMRFFT